jgi:hypothetical protein
MAPVESSRAAEAGEISSDSPQAIAISTATGERVLALRIDLDLGLIA